jgi:lipid-A-disaccharide synthase
LIASAAGTPPDLAILTDSPDFHLRAARRLKRQGVPVVYLVAPQVWAWREGRVRQIRRYVDRLLCIFPFEEAFFERRGVPASYIGHPLSRLIRPKLTKSEFFRKHRLPADRPLITMLPGSRQGEAARHLPALVEAAETLNREQAMNFVLPAAHTLSKGFFEPAIGRAPVKVIEGEAWDALAHADLALAASGTVTIEAALLGTPMVTFYKVTAASWLLGKLLVRVPYYSMVNLVAGRKVVPELMQSEMTGPRLAREARHLLADANERELQKEGLAGVARALSGGDPIARAASIALDLVSKDLRKEPVSHVS